MKRQLTEEERYEKRRRQLIMQRKRRQRRIRRARRVLTVTAVFLLAVFFLPKVFALFGDDGKGGGNREAETVDAAQVSVLSQGNVDLQVMNSLQQLYGGNAEAADILTHPENYPDDLLLLLLKRPETLEFVKDYPLKKNVKPYVDLSGEIVKGQIPVLYQWDERWGYDAYGKNIVALAGCGPTCLSMVAMGLTGDADLHPGAVASFSEKKGYVTEAGTSWDLMTVGASELGLTGEVLPLDENRMVQALEAGRPIICSMRPGDFTDTGHFIVLVGYENGAFLVHDPNSKDNTAASWTFEKIQGQIKNLWAYSV